MSILQKPGIRLLKERAGLIEPTVRIGKKGLTETAIDEIKKQLKKRRIVKVKMLKSFLQHSRMERKQIASVIAEKTSSELVGNVGFVIVLRQKD